MCAMACALSRPTLVPPLPHRKDPRVNAALQRRAAQPRVRTAFANCMQAAPTAAAALRHAAPSHHTGQRSTPAPWCCPTRAAPAGQQHIPSAALCGRRPFPWHTNAHRAREGACNAELQQRAAQQRPVPIWSDGKTSSVRPVGRGTACNHRQSAQRRTHTGGGARMRAKRKPGRAFGGREPAVGRPGSRPSRQRTHSAASRCRVERGQLSRAGRASCASARPQRGLRRAGPRRQAVPTSRRPGGMGSRHRPPL